MDLTISSTPAPRVVADTRPAADAAASARIAVPPPALALGPVVVPPSASQGALLVRSLLAPGGALDATVPAGKSSDAPQPRDVPRVLKPWGIPMLPADRPEAGDAARLDEVDKDSADPDRADTNRAAFPV